VAVQQAALVSDKKRIRGVCMLARNDALYKLTTFTFTFAIVTAKIVSLRQHDELTETGCRSDSQCCQTFLLVYSDWYTALETMASEAAPLGLEVNWLKTKVQALGSRKRLMPTFGATHS